MVYVWKRQLDFKSPRAQALLAAPAKMLGQEHVGVKIVPTNSAEPRFYEFVANVTEGTADFVAFISSSATINSRTDASYMMGSQVMQQYDYCLAGTSSKTLEDVDTFNSQYPLTYMLGIRDCRDYASDLVRFLTDLQIVPGQLTTWVNHNKPGTALA